jgi:NTP pyrophosphatase (non-canonical NTP hydrolase)
MDGTITIKHLQQYIKRKDFNPEKKHEYVLKFMEETGELARAILHEYPHAENENIKNTIEEEFYDVLFYLLAIANLYEVDIESCIPLKERETDRRYGTNYFDTFYE